MNRTRPMGWAGGLVAAAPLALLWMLQVSNSPAPRTSRARLELAIWLAVVATPAMAAAWLLGRAWLHQAQPPLNNQEGPAWRLAAATATLPTSRRHWGQAMAAELPQIPGPAGAVALRRRLRRHRPPPPARRRAAVTTAGGLTVAAMAAVALATAAALPAGRVFGLALVGLVGLLATLAVARSPRTDQAEAGPAGASRARPGVAVAGLALAGIAACLAATVYYLAEYPSYPQKRSLTVTASLAPVTAVVLAVALTGGGWLALRPPRWLVPDRHGRRLGIAMALVLVAGFVLASRQELRRAELDIG